MSNRWNVCIFSNSGLLCSRYAHFSRRLHGLIFRPQRNRVNYLFSPLPVQLLHHLQQLLSACPQMLLRSRPFVACKPLAVLFCLLCNVIILHEAMTIEIEIHMLIGRFLYGNGQLSSLAGVPPSAVKPIVTSVAVRQAVYWMEETARRKQLRRTGRNCTGKVV